MFQTIKINCCLTSIKLHYCKRFYNNTSISSLFDPTIVVKPTEWIKPENLLNPFNPLSPLNDIPLASDNNGLKLHLNSKPKIQSLLLWTAGGPASGKTTFLHNLIQMIESNYGNNPKEIMIIGNRLTDALNKQNLDMKFAIKNKSLIIIDNHCIDKQSVSNVVEFAKKNSYTTALIFPWISFETFCERLITRKMEIDRSYDLEIYWKIHLSFNYYFRSMIVGDSPFDICLAYDNNRNETKDLLFAKQKSIKYIYDRTFVDSLTKQLRSYYPSDNKFAISHSNEFQTQFIPKSYYFTEDIKLLMHYLLNDFTTEQPTDSLTTHLNHLKHGDLSKNLF